MWKTATLGSSCKMYQPKTISTKEMVTDGEYVVFTVMYDFAGTMAFGKKGL